MVADVQGWKGLTMSKMEPEEEHRSNIKSKEANLGVGAAEKRVWDIIQQEIGAFD